MSTKVLKKATDILAPVLFFTFMFGVMGTSYGQSHVTIDDAVPMRSHTVTITQPPLEPAINSVVDEIPPLLETPAAEEPTELEDPSVVPEPEDLSEVDQILAYIDEITTTRYTNLDPELIKAIVQRESRYDPTRVNVSTGVVGLMQINPRWHSARARELGVDDLTDPYGNILVGCDLLSELMDQYPHDYSLNLYAGGFDYANQYKSRISPVVAELNEIMAQFRTGELIPGGD